MKGLFTGLAKKHGIDLYDNMYDWCVRAVTIKSFPHFYDFIDNQDQNPFDNQGKFTFRNLENFAIELEIYEKAKEFTFTDPRQFIKLVRKEEMKRLKKRKNLNFQKKNDLQQQLCNLKLQKQKLMEEKKIKDSKIQKNER